MVLFERFEQVPQTATVKRLMVVAFCVGVPATKASCLLCFVGRKRDGDDDGDSADDC